MYDSENNLSHRNSTYSIGISVTCKCKKVRKVWNFYGIFSLLFGNCKRRFLIFKTTVFLFSCSVRCNAIFSSSGAVSSKLDEEVPKVAEKDALRYLKTVFVSFVLKYANKEKKTLGRLSVRWLFFVVWDRTKLWVNGTFFCCLRSHKTLSKFWKALFEGLPFIIRWLFFVVWDRTKLWVNFGRPRLGDYPFLNPQFF